MMIYDPNSLHKTPLELAMSPEHLEEPSLEGNSYLFLSNAESILGKLIKDLESEINSEKSNLEAFLNPLTELQNSLPAILQTQQELNTTQKQLEITQQKLEQENKKLQEQIATDNELFKKLEQEYQELEQRLEILNMSKERVTT